MYFYWPTKWWHPVTTLRYWNFFRFTFLNILLPDDLDKKAALGMNYNFTQLQYVVIIQCYIIAHSIVNDVAATQSITSTTVLLCWVPLLPLAYITIIIKSKRIMVQKINEAQTMTTKNHFSFYPACISFLVFPCTKSIRPKVGNSGSVFFSYRLKNDSFI